MERKISQLQAELNQARDEASCIHRIFRPDQISTLRGIKVSEWSDETVKDSIQLKHIIGTNGYQHLRKKGHPLPCISALNDRLRNMNIRPGITLDDGYTLLRLKMKDLAEQEKFAVLMIDELAIKPQSDYDPGAKCNIGTITVPMSEVDRPKEGEGKMSFTAFLQFRACSKLMKNLERLLKPILKDLLT